MNLVVISGNLGKEPEGDYTSGGKFYVRFQVAVRKRFGKQGREQEPDWIDCIAWGKTAEFMHQYLHVGDTVLVRGRIEVSRWATQEGQARKNQRVVVESVERMHPGKVSRAEAGEETGEEANGTASGAASADDASERSGDAEAAAA